MSQMLAICDAIAAKLSEATGSTCVVDVPEQIGAGDVCVSLDALEGDGELNESGGKSDMVTTIVAYDCQGVSGGGTGREAFDLVAGQLESFKESLEADVTLGNLVQQARVMQSNQFTAAIADNSYESFAEIRIEVKQW